MKKLKFYEYLEICFVVLICFFALITVCCFVASKFEEAKYALWCTLGIGVLFFAAYIRESYLKDNLPKDVTDRLKHQKENENYEKALSYVVTEEAGHKSRFVRRFGEKIYNNFVENNVITSTKKEWRVTEIGRHLFALEMDEQNSKN